MKMFIITDSCPLSSTLKYIRLCWVGHVNRMPSYRIPCLVLNEVLSNDIQCKGRPRLSFKNVIKRDLKDCSIDRSDWLNLSFIVQIRDKFYVTVNHDSDTNLEKLREVNGQF